METAEKNPKTMTQSQLAKDNTEEKMSSLQTVILI